MSDLQLLAAAPGYRVELGDDGVVHVHVGAISLRLERAACEALTTTLARAMVQLARNNLRRPPLALLPGRPDA